MIYEFIGYIEIVFYSFLYNIPFVAFTVNTPSIETEFYVYNNFITAIFLILGVIILDFLLILIGKFLYKNFQINFSKYKLGNIYFLAFILRIVPLLGHVGSIFMGFNNINIKKIIKVYLAGYMFFVLIGYYFLK